jgi:hypothetical protein
VIDKQALPVLITATCGRVEANIHAMINHRPSDVLNDDTRFVALTDVTITPLDGGAPIKHPFLALNKDSILHVTER